MPPQSRECAAAIEPLQSSTNQPSKTPSDDSTTPTSPTDKSCNTNITVPTTAMSESTPDSSTDSGSGSDQDTESEVPPVAGTKQKGCFGLWSDGDPMAREWARRGITWNHIIAQERFRQEHLDGGNSEEEMDEDTQGYDGDVSCGGEGADDEDEPYGKDG